MKVWSDAILPLPVGETPDNDWAQSLVQAISQHLTHLAQALNENLGFGNGVDLENAHGKWHSYTTNATPDAEDVIAHNLGVVPIGYLVFMRDKAGVVYKGSTAWTSSNLYLKCNVASVAVLIFIVTGPQTSS